MTRSTAEARVLNIKIPARGFPRLCFHRISLPQRHSSIDIRQAFVAHLHASSYFKKTFYKLRILTIISLFPSQLRLVFVATKISSISRIQTNDLYNINFNFEAFNCIAIINLQVTVLPKRHSTPIVEHVRIYVGKFLPQHVLLFLLRY